MSSCPVALPLSFRAARRISLRRMRCAWRVLVWPSPARESTATSCPSAGKGGDGLLERSLGVLRVAATQDAELAPFGAVIGLEEHFDPAQRLLRDFCQIPES